MTAAALAGELTKASPYRAGSRYAQDIAPQPPLERREAEKRKKLFKAEFDAERPPPGRRRGCPGTYPDGTVEVFERIIDLNQTYGNVFPRRQWLAEQCGRCVRTVAKILNCLKERNWLDWVNVIEPTPRKGEALPQIKQAPNRYLLTLPGRVVQAVAKWAKGRGMGDGAAIEARKAAAALVDAQHEEAEADKALALEIELAERKEERRKSLANAIRPYSQKREGAGRPEIHPGVYT